MTRYLTAPALMHPSLLEKNDALVTRDAIPKHSLLLVENVLCGTVRCLNDFIEDGTVCKVGNGFLMPEPVVQMSKNAFPMYDRATEDDHMTWAIGESACKLRPASEPNCASGCVLLTRNLEATDTPLAATLDARTEQCAYIFVVAAQDLAAGQSLTLEPRFGVPTSVDVFAERDTHLPSTVTDEAMHLAVAHADTDDGRTLAFLQVMLAVRRAAVGTSSETASFYEEYKRRLQRSNGTSAAVVTHTHEV